MEVNPPHFRNLLMQLIFFNESLNLFYHFSRSDRFASLFYDPQICFAAIPEQLYYGPVSVLPKNMSLALYLFVVRERCSGGGSS